MYYCKIPPDDSWYFYRLVQRYQKIVSIMKTEKELLKKGR